MNFNVNKFLKNPPGCQECQDRVQTDKYIKLSEITPLSRVKELPEVTLENNVLSGSLRTEPAHRH